ncbi:uncharacterized protein BO97DRAFT_62536 [Aspergillus homomorphus CBS 101889]|uniref:Uncharacterized protein n=1 Tax=Aspergillus homomorphus (strain CBS 101889) TaxID=1450537 RepID=A0A395HXU5_ASPHC|nr:hypothetical protein BO97DRAFT_62536 [Aspergillus homomorphus CBS 101889]RAL12213.1 hypothetical protein BO97DRAFT_62536 [Aspergillus homomorphus CBS 101889]
MKNDYLLSASWIVAAMTKESSFLLQSEPRKSCNPTRPSLSFSPLFLYLGRGSIIHCSASFPSPTSLCSSSFTTTTFNSYTYTHFQSFLQFLSSTLFASSLLFSSFSAAFTPSPPFIIFHYILLSLFYLFRFSG